MIISLFKLHSVYRSHRGLDLNNFDIDAKNKKLILHDSGTEIPICHSVEKQFPMLVIDSKFKSDFRARLIKNNEKVAIEIDYY